MVYEYIRDLAHLRRIVARNDSDTLMADQMRVACGLGHMRGKPATRRRGRKPSSEEAEYRRERRIVREMTGRLGALDRV